MKTLYWSILVLCIVTVFVPPTISVITAYVERDRVFTKYAMMDVPLLTLEKLEQENQRVRGLLNEPAASDPQRYFDLLDETYVLWQKVAKYREEKIKGFDLEFIRLENGSLGTHQQITSLQQRYRNKFGIEKMAEMGSVYHNPLMPDYGKIAETIPTGELSSYQWSGFETAYLLSLIPMFFLNTTRIKKAGLMLWPELVTLRIVPTTAVWPIMNFLYPVRIVKAGQIKMALRMAAYAFSTIFSVFGITSAAGAQSGKGKKKEKDESSTTQVIKKDIKFTIEGFPFTQNGGEQYVSPEYKWRYGPLSGFGFAEINESLFTNHLVNVDIPKIPVDITFQEGYSSSIGPFFQIGPTVNLNNTPAGKITSKVFKFISMSYFFQVVNRQMPEQASIAWAVKDIPIGEFQLVIEGFYRYRTAPKPDMAQPQVWLKRGRWKFGTEFYIFAGRIRTMFGAKVSFQP